MRLLFADADGWTAVSRDGLQVPVEFSDTQGVIYIRAHAADDGVFLLAPGMKHSSGDLEGGGANARSFFCTRSSAIAEGPRDASCQLKFANSNATVQKLLIRQVLTKSMV